MIGQHPGRLQGFVDGESLVGVGEEREVIPHLPTEQLGSLPVPGTTDLVLVGGDPLLGEALALRDEFLVGQAVPAATAVHRYIVGEPAKKAVYRQPGELADEVPTGDVHRGEGPDPEPGSHPGLVRAPHAVPEGFGGESVLADHEGSQFGVDIGLDRHIGHAAETGGDSESRRSSFGAETHGGGIDVGVGGESGRDRCRQREAEGGRLHRLDGAGSH